MNDYQHKPYRNPSAVVRVQNVEEGKVANLEIVSHVHSKADCPVATRQAPNMELHELHHVYASGSNIMRLQISVEFDNPEHVIRAQYVKWADHEMDHPVCVGNGKVANLTKDDKTEVKVRCLGPKRCSIAKMGNAPCMVDVRANVLLDADPVEIRSSSENSYTAMLAGLQYAKARSSGCLSTASLMLTTWRKSTRGSSYEAFTALDIEYAGQREEAAPTSRAMHEYGTLLHEEWNEKFTSGKSNVESLPFPTMPSFANRNYAETATNKGANFKDVASLFQDLKNPSV
ncbi:hypothetical protein [Comamonas thiooxydans]|uniref:recombination directionality factor n=1 Tax=Comamonas thiooxydans TaxID=363952 RepID=UPI0010406534|nr:hypothetical protein [Comamonas thiooxydans]